MQISHSNVRLTSVGADDRQLCSTNYTVELKAAEAAIVAHRACLVVLQWLTIIRDDVS